MRIITGLAGVKLMQEIRDHDQGVLESVGRKQRLVEHDHDNFDIVKEIKYLYQDIKIIYQGKPLMVLI